MRSTWTMLTLALPIGACASIVEGTSQQVTLITDPSGAVCTVSRDGAVLGVVNPTPGTLTVDKSKKNLVVSCEKAGHERMETASPSAFKGMTFGNILFGGLIGVGVDAATGAMHEYPATITIRLHAVDAPASAGTPQAAPAVPEPSATPVS